MIRKPDDDRANSPGGVNGAGRAVEAAAARDPARASLDVALASESATGPQTAAQWCRNAHLAVAINAGMFQPDQRSNVGYLRHGPHVNNARVNDYRSVLALRPFAWLDLDGTPTTPVPWGNHETLIQNLRLIAANRKNVWAPSPRRWSEAALALDSSGRLLFLFSRAPYSMRDFNGLFYIDAATPLFVHQYSHAWFDFRNREDRYANYFNNSQRATQAHRLYCMHLANKFPWYGPDMWGVTASDSRSGYPPVKKRCKSPQLRY